MSGNNASGGRKLFSAYTLNILFIMFAIVGLSMVSELTVKLNPGRSGNSLNISYTYPDASSQVVEHQVTSVLEGAFSTLPGIRQIESNSANGYGYITLETERGTNVETLRFHLLSLIKDIWQHLPEGVGYPEISIGNEQQTNRQLLLSYTLNGNAGTYELQQYAEKHIQPVLGEVEGIIGIETHGSTPYGWNFKYHSGKLKQFGLDPAQLADALAQWQQTQGLGTTQGSGSEGQGLSVPVSIAYSTNDNLNESWKSIPLKNINGTILRLGDVAEREIVQLPPRNYFRINGKSTVTLNIYASPVSNQIALANKFYEAEQSVAGELPEGWSLIKMYDSSEYLRREIGKTSKRIVAALLLLLLFVLLIHRSFRYLLLITISLLVNISIAVIMYYIFKVEIHLVSIAGITVSIGIIIDNYIMMADYLHHRKSLKVFMPMLGATLTTLGALVVIFFLDEADKANLVDFAMVVIINLVVSLFVALFFIPSLMTGLQISSRFKPVSRIRLRRIAKLNAVYSLYMRFSRRWRWAFMVVAILAFGLPVHLLPAKMDDDKAGSALYNSTFGSNFFTENIRIPFEKVVGGSLRLFMQHTTNRSSYYRPSGESNLYIRVSLPTGTTIEQLNEVCLKMEGYLQQFEAIRQFQTTVSGPQQAQIVVYFKPEARMSAQPGIVKSFMIQKANEFAGADFGIYMRNESFSNELTEGWRMSQIRLSGYNYRELIALARQLSDTLTLNPRIRNIAVFSGNDLYQQTSTIEEKGLVINKSDLAMAGIGYLDYINELRAYHAGPTAQTVVKDAGAYLTARFYASDLQKFDLWQLMNTGVGNDSVQLRPGEVSKLTTLRVDGNIYRKDQSYIIILAYDFIGPDELSRRVLERETAKLSKSLPLGYKAEIPEYNYSWMFGKKPMQYWLLGLIVIIIWAISAVLFESLIQPLVVVSVIPLAFVGAFLTFYLFNISFDEGGYASLLLLSGLSVNMVIYIMNDINLLRSQSGRSGPAHYIKAFNLKIVPILLTTISTILGLLPFLIFDSDTSFWTAFAAGTIGGLLFAVPMLILYLPLLMRMEMKQRTPDNPVEIQYNNKQDL